MKVTRKLIIKFLFPQSDWEYWLLVLVLLGVFVGGLKVYDMYYYQDFFNYTTSTDSIGREIKKYPAFDKAWKNLTTFQLIAMSKNTLDQAGNLVDRANPFDWNKVFEFSKFEPVAKPNLGIPIQVQEYPELNTSVSPVFLELLTESFRGSERFLSTKSIMAPDRATYGQEIEYASSGFTKGDLVIVTLNKPGSEAIGIGYPITDTQGNVYGRLTIPDELRATSGKYLLLAYDYRSLENSLKEFINSKDKSKLDPVLVGGTVVEIMSDQIQPVTKILAYKVILGTTITDQVKITFLTADNLSGIKYTEYSLDAGKTWVNLSDNTLEIESKYMETFWYRSVDKTGNLEEIHKGVTLAPFKAGL